VIEWQSDHPGLFAPAIFLYRICFSQVFTQDKQNAGHS